VLLIVGAITLIALVLPGEGTLTDLWRNSISPWFGTLVWALPFLLLALGWYVEWGPGRQSGSGWGATVAGISLAYVSLLGVLNIPDLADGGLIGGFLDDALTPLITAPGGVALLLGLGAVGLAWGLNVPLRQLFRPVTGTARWVGSTAASSLRRDEVPTNGRPARAEPGTATERSRVRSARPAVPTVDPDGVPGQTGIWGRETPGRPEIPTATPAAPQVSSTFAPAVGANGGSLTGLRPHPIGIVTVPRDPDDVTDAGDAAPGGDEPPYALPPVALLEDIVPPIGGSTMDHPRNAAIIVGKLASFSIPARVTRWNAGPVVTQYEVEPDPSVKVSRIEGLADDLAMALAARTIRIEAPIPGKSVVGLEIPNADFNVVALRRIIEEVDFAGSGSRLTFALGRDVAGHARATDLGRMPHLLIAGATGSGKSVMVNALITSLLMNATPDDVRFILVDLKRVELAAYNELPHLLVPVITEPDKAKSAVRWAVGEMESRYRRFAGATARNIAAYNESRADPHDRLPYIVIIIDELADLMMREGKNVEDPIVRLAQKARATGVHLVLATQRPSVNVVTGLIKANFPSRIAFAMASQIDSRTILDAPGAEDLIGRGDMLFQPADLPRPIRLQGVYVSDAEIKAVTEFWRSWEHHYDLKIVETDAEESSGPAEPDDTDVDRLLPDAIDVIREYDRASASLLQRRLKVGYARAARMIDQLEARGHVGPFDGSNARQVLRRETAPPASPTATEPDHE
jgi:S-DNA-T family DNA segregation ATPase FtsK/SpoIIIE